MIWDALKSASEVDIQSAAVILDAAEIIVASSDMSLCYDQKGASVHVLGKVEDEWIACGCLVWGCESALHANCDKVDGDDEDNDCNSLTSTQVGSTSSQCTFCLIQGT